MYEVTICKDYWAHWTGLEVHTARSIADVRRFVKTHYPEHFIVDVWKNGIMIWQGYPVLDKNGKTIRMKKIVQAWP